MSYNNNSKRRGGEKSRGSRYNGLKYVEGNFRNTRPAVRDALKTFDVSADKDLAFNKFSPRAISAWLS
ncbi:hypothetical protein AGMMS49991_07740 [Spirochaetia bacterium]|nr:hypothetical protein AGMMS49991_07740 [Spirochaetia bacterium]